MMPRPDPRLLTAADLSEALGLLTRLPVRVARPRGAASAWAWPLAGVTVAAGGWITGAVALALGLPALPAAALVIFAQIALTGGLHEDGLADSADGLWGGWDRERRLAIMKDSHIGSYGVIALVLSILLRVAALSFLMEAGGWGWGLIAVAAFSRAGMAALAGALPHARPDGLSASVGRPRAATAWAGAGVALVIGFLMTGWVALMLALWMAIPVMLWGRIARARIGGQTGDILGAGQQLAEIAGLLALTAALS